MATRNIAPAEADAPQERLPLIEPQGGWPADEFTGKGGSYVRDPFTGKRSPTPETAAMLDALAKA